MEAKPVAEGGRRLDRQAVAGQDGEFHQTDQFTDFPPVFQPTQLIRAQDPDEPSLRMLPGQFARGVDGPAGAGTPRFARVHGGPRRLGEGQSGHVDALGGGGARRPVAQRGLAGGKDDDLIQTELTPGRPGGGHVPEMGRVEGPSEDAEHGGHAGITPASTPSGNPKQA